MSWPVSAPQISFLCILLTLETYFLKRFIIQILHNDVSSSLFSTNILLGCARAHNLSFFFCMYVHVCMHIYIYLYLYTHIYVGVCVCVSWKINSTFHTLFDMT